MSAKVNNVMELAAHAAEDAQNGYDTIRWFLPLIYVPYDSSSRICFNSAADNFSLVSTLIILPCFFFILIVSLGVYANDNIAMNNNVNKVIDFFID